MKFFCRFFWFHFIKILRNKISLNTLSLTRNQLEVQHIFLKLTAIWTKELTLCTPKVTIYNSVPDDVVDEISKHVQTHGGAAGLLCDGRERHGCGGNPIWLLSSSRIICDIGAVMFSNLWSGLRYCEIRKEMSSLYFGLAVFCLFEARIPEFDTQPPLHAACTHWTLRQILGLNLQIGRIHLAQNTTTSLCWSHIPRLCLWFSSSLSWTIYAAQLKISLNGPRNGAKLNLKSWQPVVSKHLHRFL
jgi:hypothetical protein